VEIIALSLTVSQKTVITENDRQICIENFLIYWMQVSLGNRRQSGTCFRIQGNWVRRNFQDCLLPQRFLNIC